MRRILVILVLLCLSYYPIGALLAWQFNATLSWSTYATIGGIVGSVASVLSLLSLGAPRVSRRDIDEIGHAALQQASEITASLEQHQDELQLAEGHLAKTHERIEELKKAREEIALLVRREVMLAGLEEQRAQTIERLAEAIRNDSELLRLITRMESIERSLKELESTPSPEFENPSLKIVRDALRDVAPSHQSEMTVEVFGYKLRFTSELLSIMARAMMTVRHSLKL